MTAYEQGFLTKCAEYGIKRADAQTLLANHGRGAAFAALGAGGLAALLSKKNRFRNFWLWALLGGGGYLGYNRLRGGGSGRYDPYSVMDRDSAEVLISTSPYRAAQNAIDESLAQAKGETSTAPIQIPQGGSGRTFEPGEREKILAEINAELDALGVGGPQGTSVQPVTDGWDDPRK